MAETPRYRLEDSVPCVDIRVSSVEQLFDNRDPSPFRQRDLDPDLVDYLIDAAEDLATFPSFRIVVWVPATRPEDDIAPAFHAHFEYELQRLYRRRRRNRRVGQVSLVTALIALVMLLSLAHGLGKLPGNGLREALREGLVILSWIALWRPVEVLVYDWIPVHHRRKLLRELLDAQIETRIGKGPEVDGPSVRPARAPRRDRDPVPDRA